MLTLDEIESLDQLVKEYPDNRSCIQLLEQMRWKNGVKSPYNPKSTVYKLSCNRYYCHDTRSAFNVLTRTPLTNTKIKLTIWLAVIWIMKNNGMKCNSMQLHRDLKITQKTAYFMIQRLKQIHESDEDFIFKGQYTDEINKVSKKELFKTHVLHKFKNDEFKDDKSLITRDFNQKLVDSKIKILKLYRDAHGDKYDYSTVNYKRLFQKVVITCPVHGKFEQTSNHHLNSKKCCPHCEEDNSFKIKSFEEFVKEAREVHGDKYTYDGRNYTNNNSKIDIICPEHGLFKQWTINHLLGNGCPKCNLNSNNLLITTTEELIHEFKKAHGDRYEYDLVEYNGNLQDFVKIRCKKHGVFEQVAHRHMLGSGCYKCYLENSCTSFEEFVFQARMVHGMRYKYDKQSYTGIKNLTKITCPEHGKLWIAPRTHVNNGCLFCNQNHSSQEYKVYDVMREFDDKVIIGYRKAIRSEIDLYSTSHNFGVEIDGLYWHDEMHKPKNYGMFKSMKCLGKKIRLFNFYEDEVNDKFNILKSMIRGMFNHYTNIINGDECTIKVIDADTAHIFHENNSLHDPVNSTLSIALMYKDVIVQVTNFSFVKFNYEQVWCLDCHSTMLNTLIHDGLKIVLRYFELNHLNTEKLLTFVNPRFESKETYINHGFNFVKWRKPNYYIVMQAKRHDKHEFTKKILVEKHGCDPRYNVHSFCLEKQWYRIQDCGRLLMEKIYI